jgi:phosphate transport system ATP-binding protein
MMHTAMLQVSDPSLLPRLSTLQTQNLTLHYGTEVAFKDITLTLTPGNITALIGPSGCGKTSFLNCLNRLNELTPSATLSGRILLEGQDIRGIKVVQLRRRIGMLFQKPNPFPLSIQKNLEFPLRHHGMKSPERIEHQIRESLQQVGLWQEVKDRLRTPALSLSGGQQQRLCLARALALEPEILLMDEPCSALDPISSEIVEDLLLRLRGRYTLLVVTHNLAQAKRIADHTALFWVQDGVGTLVEAGATDELFESPQHPLTRAYITGRKG